MLFRFQAVLLGLAVLVSCGCSSGGKNTFTVASIKKEFRSEIAKAIELLDKIENGQADDNTKDDVFTAAKNLEKIYSRVKIATSDGPSPYNPGGSGDGSIGKIVEDFNERINSLYDQPEGRPYQFALRTLRESLIRRDQRRKVRFRR